VARAHSRYSKVHQQRGPKQTKPELHTINQQEPTHARQDQSGVDHVAANRAQLDRQRSADPITQTAPDGLDGHWTRRQHVG
jgi:hypothetical protein